MSKKNVFLDYGHGGSDSGACANGLVEKTMNLITGEACRQELLDLAGDKINVLTARRSDVFMSLSERTTMANNLKADCFVSIHHNAGGGDRGEYIHSIVADMGKSLANHIGDEMQTVLGQQKKVYSKQGDYNRDYYHVIRETVMEAVIVEVCFIDNATDVQIADTVEKQKRNGRVIAHGILKYYGIDVNNDTAEKPSTGVSSNLYRVRKTWEDAKSQLGAYSILENAKKNCPSGYFVFDSKGTKVYPVTVTSPTPSGCDKVVKGPYNEIGGYGVAKITEPVGIKFRDHYCTHCGKVQGVYELNETVRYDKVCITEKYTWISWIGASSNTRRWMPIKDNKTGEVWAIIIE